MATLENKENVAPSTSSDAPSQKSGTPSPKRTSRKGRSKSIGPGGLEEAEGVKQDAKTDAKNRRKSTYVPATRSIISTDTEKAERQAARRRTLANRRVSFAPEATLHTWDVVEFMRDQTTSTDSSESTRRASNITRSSSGGSPFKPAQTLDSDPPSTPPEQEDEPAQLPQSPAPQRDLHQKKRRRSSGIPPMNFNNPDDAYSSSGVSGSSSEASESEDEDDRGSDDETSTAMSLDVGDNTMQSIAESDSSTGSSARLEAALRQAAAAAGTRGIDYDEYGDASMELAGEEVTDTSKPWEEQQTANEPIGPASMDQENVNPFSPAFKAQLISGSISRPATVEEEDTADLSMDMTRAMGGVVKAPENQASSSPLGDGTMDLTQAVGKIQTNAHAQSPSGQNGKKRRRSTTDAGSPGITAPKAQPKRRRSSVARSSMGDDTMDLTIAMGGIQSAASPPKPDRRKSVAERHSSGAVSEQDDATMDFTQAIGGIKPNARIDHTSSSFDENEELTMELTTVLGGIKQADKRTEDALRLMTPQTSQSPVRDAANMTPKDQERFKDAPDSGPKKLLTPMFQKQVMHSAEKKASGSKSRKSVSPAMRTRLSVAFAEPSEEQVNGLTQARFENELSTSTPETSPPKTSPTKQATASPRIPSLGDHKSPLKATATPSPARTRSSATPDSALRLQLEAQLQGPETSPTVKKQLRSTPARSPVKSPAKCPAKSSSKSPPKSPLKSLAQVPTTPEKVDEPSQDGRRLAESIKLMSTPRKETLRNITPKKHTPAKQVTPEKAPVSRNRPTPKARTNIHISPARQLNEDLSKIQESNMPAEKIGLQHFLDYAGIRFMDLTTTKRRLTTAPTPSKARKAGDVQDDEPDVKLETAIVAGSCTLPELEMYEHSCHELKRYISDGKKVIRELEAETAMSTPALIQVYMKAGPNRQAALDAQMRDIKTHARLRSKEMWYAWRSQLLEDLMKALQGIGEGLIKDDDALRRAEEVVEAVLPQLVEKYEALRGEAEALDREASATSEEEKEELEAAREKLLAVEDEMREKQGMLEELRRQTREQEQLAADLEESRVEFQAAIKEAERVKDACRGVSINEIATLKESIKALEATHGWSIASATSSPPTVTMTYKSQLQLTFHPAAFHAAATTTTMNSNPRPNSPIRLSYIATKPPLSTTLRFFLQLLQASLHALPQSSTRVAGLLGLVSGGWDTALAVAEAERRLHVEGMTESRIVSDERMAISSTILLPKVRTKVRVSFEIAAAVADSDGLELGTTVEASVTVVYGEPYNEEKMTDFVEKEVSGGGGLEGWNGAVRELKSRLIARGPAKKGAVKK